MAWRLWSTTQGPRLDEWPAGISERGGIMVTTAMEAMTTLRSLFDEADVDKSGSLDREELSVVLKK